MLDVVTPATPSYESILSDYLKVQSESSLYQASLLSKQFIEQGVGPEEIVALHSESLERMMRPVPMLERARMMGLSLQFLLEIMISYGIRYKEYLDLRMTEATRAIRLQMEVERVRSEEAVRIEQIRLEERVRAEQEAMRSKEDFLAFIAHELRTPITVIRGSVELALRRSQQEASERVRSALENADRGLQRLMHLSEELLVLSREERTELQLQIEAVDMGAVIAGVVAENQATATAKEITLRVEPPGAPLNVLGDREWLGTVMDNLVGNALKYTNAGGHVTIRTHAHPRRLQIDVVDTGIGIPADALPYIFEKYYRVSTPGGGFVKGTGLGLALVKRVVERHGGDVRVQSELDQGSTFSVYLPLATAEPANG